MTKTVTIQTDPHYKVIFQPGCCQSSLDWVETLPEAAHGVLISDSTVAPLYTREIVQAWQLKQPVLVITMPAGEVYKTREVKAELEDQMLAAGCGRDTVVLAVGGGVVTDMAGFIAATYCRGVPVVYVPTTLLSMVDASIGGKTGVNTPLGKNMIGTFKQPAAVWIDSQVLATLTADQFNAGVAEMYKHALLAGAAPRARLMSAIKNALPREQWHDLIAESCQLKATIVEQDVSEAGVRQLLNLGHTFAHAIETECHYQLLHGHAVWLGLWAEVHLSERLGLLSAEDARQCYQELAQIKFTTPIPLKAGWLSRVMHAMQQDKKVRQQQVYAVGLTGIKQSYRQQAFPIIQPAEADCIATWQWLAQQPVDISPC